MHSPSLSAAERSTHHRIWSPPFVVSFWISIIVLLVVVILRKRQIGGKGVFAYYLLLFKLDVCRLIKLKSIPSGMYQVPGGPVR